MANQLKAIHPRAKQIYKKPGFRGTYADAVKKAFAEKRGGRKKSKPKKRRKVSGTLSSGARPSSYAVGRVRKRRRVSGTLSDSPRPSGFSVGALMSGLSSAQHIGHAKEKIGMEIARAELQKFKAKKKSIKNKIAKRIAALKSKYRKLC